jgi:rare lipoprotein A
VGREALVAPGGQSASLEPIIPGHKVGGNFYPDPVVTELPVTRTGIYIQAGSFTVQENAMKLSAQLQPFHESQIFPIVVNGKQYYRVRLGPIGNVGAADTLLNRLVQSGFKDPIIVVE